MINANPFSDLVSFLVGTSHDYGPFGASRYILVAFYLALIAGSFYVAYLNWARDPAQRNAQHVSVWLMRLLAAGLWYQGTLWKLPLPVSDAFSFWTGALAKYTSFAPHAWLVKTVFLPYIFVLQPAIYLTEIFFAVSLSLGLFVRFSSLLIVLFTAHLWIGLYNDPTEWPWTYIAIMIAHGMFVAHAAGRSLGLDNLLRRAPPSFVVGATPLARRMFWLAT
jgi:uncharacterized membrane protein YphA (DoxX/SURF4 family)